jgi:hypothetical protein
MRVRVVRREVCTSLLYMPHRLFTKLSCRCSPKLSHLRRRSPVCSVPRRRSYARCTSQRCGPCSYRSASGRPRAYLTSTFLGRASSRKYGLISGLSLLGRVRGMPPRYYRNAPCDPACSARSSDETPRASLGEEVITYSNDRYSRDEPWVRFAV